MVEKKSISFQTELYQLLEIRKDEGAGGTRSEVINRDLSRYYRLLFTSQIEIFKKFTSLELTGIFVSLNGSLNTKISEGLLYQNVADSHAYGELAGIEGLEATPLLEKISDLNYAEQVAVIDLAERFWIEVSKDRGDFTVNELRDTLIKEYLETLR